MCAGSNIVLGNGIERLSGAERELLYILARNVPVGQAILDLNSGENEATSWLSRGANEAAGNKVYSINMYDPDSELGSWRWKKKIGLLWYSASGEYEDLKKALLFWQGSLSPEARVVFHGYQRPGVAMVIKECIGTFGNFIFVGSIETIAVLAIGGCAHYWIIDCKEMGICKYCGRKRNFRRGRGESPQRQHNYQAGIMQVQMRAIGFRS